MSRPYRYQDARTDMEWTPTGARIMSAQAVSCPVCRTVTTPGVEHVCGDRDQAELEAKKARS